MTVPRSYEVRIHDDSGTLPRRLRRLANEARVALEGPHPSLELVTITATPEPCSSSPAMLSSCPTGAALGPRTIGMSWTTAANHGQPIVLVSSRFRAFVQVARSPGLSLARRKSAARYDAQARRL
jgi:hypothetical protein